MAGGRFPHDRLDVAQYSEEEMHAAVGAAADWVTYVAVHAADGRRHRHRLRVGHKVDGPNGIRHRYPLRSKMAEKQEAREAAREAAWWYTPAEVLKMATADNAELMALFGPGTPYLGKLGVVEEGALADLVLVDGDPIANIQLIADPEKNFW